MTGSNPWLFRPRGAPVDAPDASVGAPRPRLFALPYAGGGSSVFHGLARRLEGSVDLAPVLLPGRERRLSDPPPRRMDALVEALERGLAAELEGPFALFGHSLGALVAFELARRLRARGRTGPVRLFVSAGHAPHRVSRNDPIHGLPDAEFVAAVERLGGMPRVVLEQRELLELMLPTLRADFEVYETYRFEGGPPLDCPITALGGERDAHVPRQDLEAWGEVTRGPLETHWFPDGHFFLQGAEERVARIVRAALVPAADASL